MKSGAGELTNTPTPRNDGRLYQFNGDGRAEILLLLGIADVYCVLMVLLPPPPRPAPPRPPPTFGRVWSSSPTLVMTMGWRVDTQHP